MILREFIRGGVKHGLRLFREPVYREWCRLEGRYSHFPRYQELYLTAGGMQLHVPDAASFLSAWREIFLRGIYRFECSNSVPVIVDMGANIGLSVIFLKHLFPDAELIAYEADPYIFHFLKENVSRNVSGELTLHQLAIWDNNSSLLFRSDHADGGSVVNRNGEGTVEVRGIDIREVLESYERIDFLKMDIEGAERKVIPAAGRLLSRVKRIFVEYHSAIGERQNLAQVLGTLEEAGFRLRMESSASAVPFLERRNNSGLDLQINIWGIREMD